VRAEPDAPLVRVVARIRVAVAIGLAATGSFLPHLAGRGEWLFLVIGLLWVPWAGVVLLAVDSPSNRLGLLGGPIGDIVVLFAVQVLTPGMANAVLPGYAAVIAFAAYSGGRSFASVLAAGALTFALAAHQLSPATPFDNGAAALLGAVLVALVLLLDRTANMQQLAQARSARLEGKSDAILAHVADGVVVTDATGRILQANPAAGRLLSQDESELLGRRCSDVLALRVGERALDCSRGCALLAGGAAGETALGQEVWRPGPDGRRQPLLANAVAVGKGDVEHEVVHSVRDITQVKQADEAKTLFLATASHELRTPLTVISGFASALRAEPDTEPGMRDKALEAIERRTFELTKIIDRLLLSSRIESGRVDLRLAPTAIGPILRERAESLAAATRRPVIVDLPAELPTVYGDAGAIVTVVDHLLDNAIKYSPGGDPIELKALVAGEDVRIQVIDAGVGMTAEQVAHCFDKFWQAESTDVRRFGGTGIGLYIVRSLVEAMKGDIDVTSALGRGSTFTVVLRVAGPPDPEPPAPTSEPSVIREFMRQIGVPMGADA
jgi:PAS domain S-box-containing protein